MIDTVLLIEEYIKFISDTYIDFNGVMQNGAGKFNEAIDAYNLPAHLKINGNYSMGYQPFFSDDYLIGLQLDNNINKDRGLIDARAYLDETALSVELRKTGDSSSLYILANFLPMIMNQLAVDFFNAGQDLPYFALSYDTKVNLSAPENTPTPFASVNAVFARQTLRASLQKLISPVGG